MKRSKIYSFFLFIILLTTAACSPGASAPATTALPEEQAAVAPTEVPPTETAESEPVEPQTLTVIAAASLTESFTELGTLFESENEGVTVALSFAGSQACAQQLEQGAEADVFASANTKYMTAAIESERVNEADPQIFAHNRLVVIFPQDNPGGITELADLAKSGLKIDLADQSVPVGNYTYNFLEKTVENENFDPQFMDDVLNNVVSYEDNVKAVVTKVSLDEADAGIVYVTDITAEAAENISTIDIPDELNTIATYPIAPLSDSKNPELAKAFVDFVLSSEGQAVLADYGFVTIN